MTYSCRLPISHSPQSLHELSKNCRASRLALTSGPQPFSGISCRNSLMIGPTPDFRHFFGPMASPADRAQAMTITVENAGSIFPLEVFPGKWNVKPRRSIKALPSKNDGKRRTLVSVRQNPYTASHYPRGWLPPSRDAVTPTRHVASLRRDVAGGFFFEGKRPRKDRAFAISGTARGAA